MELNIEKVEILLLIAAVVAIAARRLRIPYTIALAIVVVRVSRAAAIYPISFLFSRSALKIKDSYQHILFWRWPWRWDCRPKFPTGTRLSPSPLALSAFR